MQQKFYAAPLFQALSISNALVLNKNASVSIDVHLGNLKEFDRSQHNAE
jgi:hypothetical protein